MIAFSLLSPYPLLFPTPWHFFYRDAYLTALCTACLPEHYSIATEVPPGGWEVSSKHLQCVHILLNSALCLGPQMDTGWNLIIATCQQVGNVESRTFNFIFLVVVVVADRLSTIFVYPPPPAAGEHPGPAPSRHGAVCRWLCWRWRRRHGKRRRLWHFGPTRAQANEQRLICGHDGLGRVRAASFGRNACTGFRNVPHAGRSRVAACCQCALPAV